MRNFIANQEAHIWSCKTLAQINIDPNIPEKVIAICNSSAVIDSTCVRLSKRFQDTSMWFPDLHDLFKSVKRGETGEKKFAFEFDKVYIKSCTYANNPSTHSSSFPGHYAFQAA